MTPQVKQAILKTLAYADIFDYPLKEEEIWRRVINVRSHKSNVKCCLQNLKHSKLIQEKDGYYFFSGRSELVNIRKKREKWSEEKLKLAQKTACFLKVVSTVKLVGVSGALAVLNTKEKDDIDLFIIASKNHLWTTRFLTTVLLEILGNRRRPKDTELNNKICLNMFVDENHLLIPKKEQNLYTAYEVIQMNPLWNRDKIYQKFIESNLWVKKYLPNSIANRKQKTENRKQKKRKTLLDILEVVLKIFQLWYMRNRRSNEVITDHLIRFHPQDAQIWVRDKYKKRLSKVGFV